MYADRFFDLSFPALCAKGLPKSPFCRKALSQASPILWKSRGPHWSPRRKPCVRYLSFQFKIIPFWTISFWDNERNSLPKGFSRLPKTAIHIFPFLKKLSVYITPDSSIVFYSESVTVSDWNFISWNFICIVQSPSLCWGGRPTKRIKKHCIFAIL